MKIKILPDNLTNKIAAGEVIERPASIVKELLENSIDAKSTNIVVEIESGGKKLISVSDNGIGMDKNNALLSIERYATSKIKKEDDIFKIESLGFRGEAIPSIASVSKFELISKDEISESATKIIIEGGKIKNVSEVGTKKGTKITIKNLFFNVPARKKFLKGENTETGYIAELFTSLAIFWNDIQFKFINNGKKIYSYQQNSSEERILDVLKINKKEYLLKISSENEYAQISGFISSPNLTRSNAKKIYIYINGRNIKDRVLSKALFEGYSSKLVKGKFPVAVLFIKIPFDEVDVNVHPSKSEVRIENIGKIYQMLESAVSETLETINETKWEENFYEPQIMRRDKVREEITLWQKNESLFFEEEHNAQDFNIEEKSVSFKSLKILGQFNKTYILCEDTKDKNLIIIDQHAADEIIVFEKLKKEFYKNYIKSQILLIPITIEIGFRETQFLNDIMKNLNSLGFDIENFGDRTFIIKAVPYMLSEKPIEPLINEIIEKNISITGKINFEEILDESLITIACHSAIRAGQNLSFFDMQNILENLDKCKAPSNCPHGRPTWIKFEKKFLDKSFSRIV